MIENEFLYRKLFINIVVNVIEIVLIKIMYDENYDEVHVDPWAPRCSITTFLHRIAFTVLHASFFLERKNIVKQVGFFLLLLTVKN